MRCKPTKLVCTFVAAVFTTTAALAQSQVTLAWNASSDGTVTGYRVYQGSQSHAYGTVTNVGKVTQAVVGSLSIGKTYYFAVTAYNANGVESDYSSELAYTASTATNSPPPPPTQTNSPPPATGGLVAAYGFEDGAGTAAADSSGAGNTAVVKDTSWITGGRFGRAVAFNGTSSVITVNDSASLHLSNGMTLEAWIYPTELANWDPVIYKGNDAYYLDASTSLTSGPVVGLGSSTSANSLLSSANALPLNQWSHIAGTYDGSTVRIFVNGVLAASRAQSTPISVTTLPLTIGGDTINGRYYQGVIDEVRVYNRALAASEIQADMNSPVSSNNVPLQWTSRDIGSVRAPGSAVVSNGVMQLSGAGSLASTSDSFQFLYQPLSADGEISAQLSAASGKSYTAGVMIRETLAANSSYVFMGAMNGKVRRLNRTNTGRSTSASTGNSINLQNYWIRLVRSGNSIVRYRSPDGKSWSKVDTIKTSMASEIYMGLAVTSDGTTNRASASFSNVKATP